ncbi:ATP-binding protein [Myroides sp.]|uniref:tetratricopeptide repeat-containing sensor histidine kinase n=1 Tax=Myroides sp. TaxID=1874736 RepID=UPI003F3B511D
MKRLRQIIFLLVVIALLLVNCTRSKIVNETDYDQLYAVWYDNDYKDSLAQALKPAVQRALTLSNTVDNRVSIDSVLNELRWTRDSVSFHKLSRKAIKYAKSKSDEYMLANAYNDIGMYYHDLNVMDSTFYYYIKAENVYKQVGDSMKIGEMEFYQARLLFEKGLHMESEVKVSNALHILKDYPLNPIPFEANQLMALCLLERNDYKEAKKYMLEALTLMQKDFKQNKVLDKPRLVLALSMLYLNLSEVSYLLKNYSEAINYAKVGLTYTNSDTPDVMIGVIKSYIAMSNMCLALDTHDDIDGEEYIKEIRKTYEEAKRINNPYIANAMAMTAAELYLKINDSEKAFEWAEKSFELSKERDIKVAQRRALEFLVLNKEYDNKEQVRQIIELGRDLEEQDYATRNRFARIAYETERIETENSQLRNMISTIVSISLVIVLTLVIGVYVYRLKNKNKEIQFIKDQQEANESIYQLILERSVIATEVKNNVRNKIAKDIHDGVVNGIFTIRFNLQQLKSENEDMKGILVNELQSLEKRTRDISHSLIDNELFEHNKFVSLIEDLLALQKNQWNTEFLLDYENAVDLEDLSALDKVNTYFIIREAIQNVNKYSQASICKVSFTKEKKNVVIKIKDNGVGFDEGSSRDGMGLQNMNERAIALHSELIIHSKKGMGTELMFKIKIK